MSSAKQDTLSSNENWKKGGGKTKRGKPTGRREVVEKYKAIGAHTIEDRNRKQYGIEARAWQWGLDKDDDNFLGAIFAKERRQANKLALQDQLLALEEEEQGRNVSQEGGQNRDEHENKEVSLIGLENRD
ncbi:hypothetical protein J7T55_012453 [Diaporthe amygdali]|uniref:uncharacterized protein n=1 Tax=Phomopsis amygdali TaxID=1214568 RepID=UPI0022FF0F10|nr:uncharacterized protein J7T55_012453 [Diaporthe amygdali]KAJ0123980.1 hypothetical protein J7T55_012453 [Diaporthe amygdali]